MLGCSRAASSRYIDINRSSAWENGSQRGQPGTGYTSVKSFERRAATSVSGRWKYDMVWVGRSKWRANFSGLWKICGSDGNIYSSTTTTSISKLSLFRRSSWYVESSFGHLQNHRQCYKTSVPAKLVWLYLTVDSEMVYSIWCITCLIICI